MLNNTFTKRKHLKEKKTLELSRENHVYCSNTEQQGWTGCEREDRDGDRRLSWLKRGHLSTDKRQNDRFDEAAAPRPWSKNQIKKGKNPKTA